MKLILWLFLILYSSYSLAGGFDVNNLWSATYSAVGGAAVSNVSGAQSVSFNPAGLSKSYTFEVDFNLDSAFIQKSAPLKSDGTSTTSGVAAKHTPAIFIPIVGFFWTHQMSKHLGIGAGLYAAGGSGGPYEDVNFGSSFTDLKPDIESSIVLVEWV